MYAGSSYAPTSGAGTSSAKQTFSSSATSTGSASNKSDDGPGYGQLYSNTAMALTAAGATLKAPTQAVYNPMNLYSSPNMQEIATEIKDYLRGTSVDDALREALNIPEVYQGAQTQEEPDPIVDTDKLKDALQPEPITVEELPDVIVKAGDTLTAIAEANGVPVQDVIDANPQIANPDMIRPGEVVKLSSRFDTKGETPSRDLPAATNMDNLQLVDIEDETAFNTKVKSFVELNEGRKNTPYKDTKGLWTVGVGHLIGKTLPKEFANADGTPRTLSDREVDKLFTLDYEKHKQDAEQLPMYKELNDKGKQALIDLSFNMGSKKFNEKEWPKFFAALKDKDLKKAAAELKDSQWFTDVKRRAPRVIKLIKQAEFR